MFSFFKKQEKRDIKMPAHLSRAEQKEIREIIKRAENNDGIPRTAQQSIPFDRMFQDGICRIGADYYTKTIQFQDINYQLALQEDKTEIFEEWCAFLNFFDSSVHFELSFMNMATDVEDFRTGIAIPHKKDEYNGVRDEYSSMLFHQMEAGNNGLTKTKYLTFGIHADSMKAAKPRIIHIETDILNNFKRLGVQARVLNGKERLALMHQQFHMGDREKFNFDWKYLLGSGLSVKDFIAPSSFSFPTGKRFTMGSLYGAMSFLSIDASDISDRMLADFLNMESSQIVTMHIQSVDQNEAIKTVSGSLNVFNHRTNVDITNRLVCYDIKELGKQLKKIGMLNIQIFGTKKCNETKKAERFFKERGIKYQFVDMKEKGMSKGEFMSVAQVNGGIENMINWDGKDQDTLALIRYIADEDKLKKILENPFVIKTPVVRNGKQSTLGYQPEVWKKWQ